MPRTREVDSTLKLQRGQRSGDTSEEVLGLGGVTRDTAGFLLSEGWVLPLPCEDAYLRQVRENLTEQARGESPAPGGPAPHGRLP